MEPRNQIAEPNFADLQGTWLISFADLITLLLCAFLMFFSLTWNKPTTDGTRIAPNVMKSQEANPLERRIKIRFEREEVDLMTGKLTEAALKKVKAVIDLEAYKSSLITLSRCFESGDGNSGPALEQALLSQLIDAGVPAKQLVTRFVGSNCELLGSTNRAIIEFERM